MNPVTVITDFHMTQTNLIWFIIHNSRFRTNLNFSEKRLTLAAESNIKFMGGKQTTPGGIHSFKVITWTSHSVQKTHLKAMAKRSKRCSSNMILNSNEWSGAIITRIRPWKCTANCSETQLLVCCVHMQVWKQPYP